METNIQNMKIELIQWLTTLNDQSTLQKIIELRDNSSNDWWDDISDTEKKSIEKGITDSENGKVVLNSEIRKKYEKWL